MANQLSLMDQEIYQEISLIVFFLEFFCESLESCAFDKLILAEELFAKLFGSFRKLSIS